jgi:hypothetical protein
MISDITWIEAAPSTPVEDKIVRHPLRRTRRARGSSWAKMTDQQLDLFRRNTARSTKSPVGLEVKLDRPCDCGKELATICLGCGLHHAELRCAKCDAHRMSLRGDAWRFLAEICERFGRPTTPVVIRGDHEEL